MLSLHIGRAARSILEFRQPAAGYTSEEEYHGENTFLRRLPIAPGGDPDVLPLNLTPWDGSQLHKISGLKVSTKLPGLLDFQSFPIPELGIPSELRSNISLWITHCNTIVFRSYNRRRIPKKIPATGIDKFSKRDPLSRQEISLFVIHHEHIV